MKLDAMKHQGQRTDLTSNPQGRKLVNKETAQIVGEENGDSQTQVRRYVRLTYLVPELLEMVDEGRIKMRPAVEISYLDEDNQRDLQMPLIRKIAHPHTHKLSKCVNSLTRAN